MPMQCVTDYPVASVWHPANLTGGIRYSKDKKKGAFRAITQNVTAAQAAEVTNDLRLTDSQVTYRINGTYKPTDDVMLFTSFSTGFKSGGFDPRGDAILTPTTSAGFNPEKVNSYEFGLKGNLNHTLTFSSAVFYSQYRDQQVTLQRLVGTTAASQVENAGRSKSAVASTCRV